ncbi:hypothetical protein Agub_g6061 [Astrephomene gubernaculifera]|uniref:FAD-binding FR-type domain-containing protein n=1 Tax=Astrephomene gubernaculifera TaxID=47775 RepID=A0AAD3HL44_9CHLO|nr:hypothetical protein Agub_g6061 [Astrephomene gubernaculifera]
MQTALHRATASFPGGVTPSDCRTQRLSHVCCLPRPHASGAGACPAVSPSSGSSSTTTRGGCYRHGACTGAQRARYGTSSSSRRTAVRVQANWGAQVEFKAGRVVSNSPVAAGPLHRVLLDVGPLAGGYSVPGQFVQVKVGDSKPGFFAIASAPGAHPGGLLELLVKGVPGSTAELLCSCPPDSEVAVSPVMGRGFPLDRLPASSTPSVLLFATGSGISPIRAVLDSGALAGREVTLYYGTRNEESTPYRELLPEWRSRGVQVVQVFSEGDRGYVHDVFEREGLAALPGEAPGRVGALLCGHKAMCQAVTSLLTNKGVPPEKILLNF